jgi:hypothetical protein
MVQGSWYVVKRWIWFSSDHGWDISGDCGGSRESFSREGFATIISHFSEWQGFLEGEISE